MARKPPPPGTGGKREGSGRKPSEFLEKCRDASRNPKFFDWANKALAGDNTEVKINPDGERIMVPATAGDRTYLWEKLAAYGFGKPSQPVEVSGELTGRICVIRAES